MHHILMSGSVLGAVRLQEQPVTDVSDLQYDTSPVPRAFSDPSSEQKLMEEKLQEHVM